MAFSNASSWLRLGSFSLFNRISVVFFGFLNVYFLVRIITPEEVGVWILFLSLSSLFETIRNGFIRNPFISFYVSSPPEEQRHLIPSSIFLHVLLALTMVVTLLVFGATLEKFWDASNLNGMLQIYAITTVFLIPYLQLEYIMQANLNFRGIFISNFIKLVFLTGYIGYHFVAQLKPELQNLVIVQLFSVIIAGFVSFSFVRHGLAKVLMPSKVFIAKLFHFGKYTFGTTISSMLIRNTDSWMIGRMISPIGVAMYNPALRISNIVEVPTLAVVSIVFPQINTKIKEQGLAGLQDIYLKSVSLILAVMIPIVIPLYFFSDWIVLTIFGSAYMEASPILKVTIFYTLIIPFNRQFGTVMDAIKTPKINFYLLLVMMVINVGFNYLLIDYYGVIGAAYGTLFSFLIIFIVNQLILYKRFRINVFLIPKQILLWYSTVIDLVKSR